MDFNQISQYIGLASGVIGIITGMIALLQFMSSKGNTGTSSHDSTTSTSQEVVRRNTNTPRPNSTPRKSVDLAIPATFLCLVGVCFFSYYLYNKALQPPADVQRKHQLREDGYNAISEQRWSEALTNLEALTKGSTDQSFNTQKVKSAITQLKILEKKPLDFKATFHLALIMDSLQQDEESLILYQKAIELNPRSPEAHRGFAYELERRGKLRKNADDLAASKKHHDIADKINPDRSKGLLNALK